MDISGEIDFAISSLSAHLDPDLFFYVGHGGVVSAGPPRGLMDWYSESHGS